MDQYKLEKYTEWIYSRLERRVKPNKRSKCGALDEMRQITIMIKDKNLDAMDVEFGMPSMDSCDQCDGECFKED
ncbi:MAG: hypothetical protein SA339_11915 [Methanomassiliicoccus sp.]|nr:hypothetical protein [Methanomassiliicoccus sp.]